jgi:hypothetical protein
MDEATIARWICPSTLFCSDATNPIDLAIAIDCAATTTKDDVIYIVREYATTRMINIYSGTYSS